MRSCDKLKTLYFQYDNAYGQKMWQDDDLPFVTSTHKTTWPCKVTGQTKIITYPSAKCLWPSILTDWGYIM